MRHDIMIKGYAFKLRPIADSDAEFVVALRSDQQQSNRYLHQISNRVEDQLIWLNQYYTRPNDYYFVIECLKSGNSEGLISVYNIDMSSKCGEWGRWIIRRNSLASVESAWLIYRVSFEVLNLDFVYCRTVADNRKVASFHDSCGITSRCILKDFYTIEGRIFDAIEHTVTKEVWNEVTKPLLQKIASLTAKKIIYV